MSDALFQEVLPRATHCPVCPWPPTDERAELAACFAHQPSRGGADDGRVPAPGYFQVAEATGEFSRAIQELIR